MSYAQLMHNYFVNMVFDDIIPELDRLDQDESLNKLGGKVLTIVAIVIFPVLLD